MVYFETFNTKKVWKMMSHGSLWLYRGKSTSHSELTNHTTKTPVSGNWRTGATCTLSLTIKFCSKRLLQWATCMDLSTAYILCLTHSHTPLPTYILCLTNASTPLQSYFFRRLIHAGTPVQTYICVWHIKVPLCKSRFCVLHIQEPLYRRTFYFCTWKCPSARLHFVSDKFKYPSIRPTFCHQCLTQYNQAPPPPPPLLTYILCLTNASTPS